VSIVDTLHLYFADVKKSNEDYEQLRAQPSEQSLLPRLQWLLTILIESDGPMMHCSMSRNLLMFGRNNTPQMTSSRRLNFDEWQATSPDYHVFSHLASLWCIGTIPCEGSGGIISEFLCRTSTVEIISVSEDLNATPLNLESHVWENMQTPLENCATEECDETWSNSLD
jgi:hypothetical protein